MVLQYMVYALHHLAASLKRIASAINRLDFARQSVGQGGFGRVPRVL